MLLSIFNFKNKKSNNKVLSDKEKTLLNQKIAQLEERLSSLENIVNKLLESESLQGNTENNSKESDKQVVFSSKDNSQQRFYLPIPLVLMVLFPMYQHTRKLGKVFIL